MGNGSSESLIDIVKVVSEIGIIEGDHIIEVGFGNGYMTEIFSGATGSKGEVTAIEINEEKFNNFSSSNNNIHTLIGDITLGVDIPDGYADIIYLATVFHIFSEEKAADFFKEAGRLLKRGGRLFILNIDKKDTGFGPPVDMRYSPEEVIELTDMKYRNTIRAGEHFYMVSFIKD